MDDDDVTVVSRIDIAEFRRLGYLSELNRRFLHPLGLALEVITAGDGTETLGGVWDYRDDPEGINFVGDQLPVIAEHAAFIDAEWERRRPGREAGLGYMVQPVT